MTVSPELHPHLESLGVLVGRWEGTGHGHYPTIDDFEFAETTEFGHVGKPFLSYRQATRSNEGMPLHAEAGYWRVPQIPDVELVLAQPFGAVEISVGGYRVDNGVVIIEIATTTVSTTPTAKSLSEVSRRLEVDGDSLHYRMGMAAVGKDHQSHLEATLHRV